jgi:predicted RNA methylase
MKIVGPLPIIDVLLEDNGVLYLTDYQDKVVLDVGGFIDDTAVLFATLGAKKVIIYEPVVAHHEIIKINLSFNAVNAEIHEEGIGEIDGLQR